MTGQKITVKGRVTRQFQNAGDPPALDVARGQCGEGVALRLGLGDQALQHGHGGGAVASEQCGAAPAVRKLIGATMTGMTIGIALLVGAGTAQADPNSPPSPTPAPAPTRLIPASIVAEAQDIVADAIQQTGRDPQQASEIAQRIIGQYLP